MTKRAQAALTSPDRIGPVEVTVHTAFEQHMTTQTMTNDNDSNEQVHEKPNGAWGFDDDVERGM